MIKNYTKYGPTGILWALYLIVGVVAFLVSNLYFKFELKDAIIFGVVNLVVVVAITEGIDWLFKKARLRQERKAAEKQTAEVAPSDETVEEVPSDESAEVIASDETVEDIPEESVPAVEGHVDDEAPLLITGAPGYGKNFHLMEYAVSLKNAESDDSETKETIVDEDAKETPTDDKAPILITAARGGSARGYWSEAQLAALRNADSVDSEEDTIEPAVESSAPVDSQPHDAEDAVVEQEIEDSTKPRGRRANPDAVIDAPTSSMPIITPDMLKPKVEPIVEPVVEETTVAEPVTPVVETLVVEEPEADETYLSADEFLDTTKLTSPRAIVREYQRLGGKDDIYSILMERQK